MIVERFGRIRNAAPVVEHKVFVLFSVGEKVSKHRYRNSDFLPSSTAFFYDGAGLLRARDRAISTRSKEEISPESRVAVKPYGNVIVRLVGAYIVYYRRNIDYRESRATVCALERSLYARGLIGGNARGQTSDLFFYVCDDGVHSVVLERNLVRIVENAVFSNLNFGSDRLAVSRKRNIRFADTLCRYFAVVIDCSHGRRGACPCVGKPAIVRKTLYFERFFVAYRYGVVVVFHFERRRIESEILYRIVIITVLLVVGFVASVAHVGEIEAHSVDVFEVGALREHLLYLADVNFYEIPFVIGRVFGQGKPAPAVIEYYRAGSRRPPVAHAFGKVHRNAVRFGFALFEPDPHADIVLFVERVNLF